MSDADNIEDEENPPPKKGGKKGLLIGLFLALLLGGGGFYASYSGLIGGAAKTGDTHDSHAEELPKVGFVELDPLIISLGERSGKHLRFRASLEIEPEYEAEVTHMTPRIFDILNSYLRAVDLSMIEDPSALIMLRAQMLRRIQLVTGEGRVRDLLIIEFVLT